MYIVYNSESIAASSKQLIRTAVSVVTLGFKIRSYDWNYGISNSKLINKHLTSETVYSHFLSEYRIL